MEDYGSTFVTIEDEEGNEIELEHLDTVVHEDNEYMAFIPADTDADSEEVDFFILRVEDEDDEQLLVTIEDEKEQQRIYEVFMKRINEDEDE